MKKRKAFRLSRSFLGGYKQYLEREINLKELKKRVKTPDDVIFFQEECDIQCNVEKELQTMLQGQLDSLTEIILSEMENEMGILRRAIIQKVLIVFLGIYICYAKGEKKTKAEELLFYFTSSLGDVPSSEKLNQRILEMMNILVSSRYLVEDEEPLVRPIILKLISLYAGLGISDKNGIIKCGELGKQLYFKWEKTTPESVTLSCLKMRVKNSKLPINECELLEKYSF